MTVAGQILEFKKASGMDKGRKGTFTPISHTQFDKDTDANALHNILRSRSIPPRLTLDPFTRIFKHQPYIMRGDSSVSPERGARYFFKYRDVDVERLFGSGPSPEYFMVVVYVRPITTPRLATYSTLDDASDREAQDTDFFAVYGAELGKIGVKKE